MFREPAGTLLVIAVIAFTAPLLTTLAPWLRLPTLVIEILLGIVVGPQVLNLVEITAPIQLISDIGLASLIFLAGFELDPARVVGTPMRLAVTGWAMSVGLGLAAAAALIATDIVQAELYVGLALTTTALGTLLPILRDSGLLATRFGTQMLAVGSVGEFLPIVAVAVALSDGNPFVSVLSLSAFTIVAVLALRQAGRPHHPRVQAALGSTLRTSGQLYIRAAILFVSLLTFVASELGLDFLLGAFTAGAVFRLLMVTGATSEQTEQVEAKLEALTLGYLVPIFFVTTGVAYDLHALTSSPTGMLKVPIFLGLLLVVRGVPVALYRRAVPDRNERTALAFFSATGLPLIVAITSIGVAAHKMRTSTAAALVGAGMLSVVVFPIIGKFFLDRASSAEADVAADPAVG